MPRSDAPTTARGSSEAGVPLITLSSEGGHEYAAHPLPSAAAAGRPAAAMSGAVTARAAMPDAAGGAFGNHMVDYAGEREGLLGDAPPPNPYARRGGGGGYAAPGPMLPPMPRVPAPTVAAALPFVANARGAYARAPAADDDAEADGLEPYRDVHPAMREDAAVAAAAAAGVDPFRDVHPALRERPPEYEMGMGGFSEDDKEIAPGSAR